MNINADIRIETLAQIRKRHRDEVNSVLRSYAIAGYTQAEVARELDASLTQINNIIVRNNIPWPVIRQGNHGKQDTSELEAALAECAREGMTKAEAGRKLGIPYRKVSRLTLENMSDVKFSDGRLKFNSNRRD